MIWPKAIAFGHFKYLVRPARFERAAYGFEVRRSIQLSYGRLSLHSKNLVFLVHFDAIRNLPFGSFRPAALKAAW